MSPSTIRIMTISRYVSMLVCVVFVIAVVLHLADQLSSRQLDTFFNFGLLFCLVQLLVVAWAMLFDTK